VVGEGGNLTMAKNQYQTGVKSRELILSGFRTAGGPMDVSAIATATGMTRRHVRYNVGVMIKLGELFLHHFERNNFNRVKAFYWTEPRHGSKRTIKLMD
jgi:hypothetical protein